MKAMTLRIRSLPEAHGKPIMRGHRLIATVIPRRTSTPRHLAAAQDRAMRLLRPRRAHLERSQLHNHEEHGRTVRMTNLVVLYVETGDAGLFAQIQPTPWQHHAIDTELRRLDTQIPGHQWYRRWRSRDIRLQLDYGPAEDGRP